MKKSHAAICDQILISGTNFILSVSLARLLSPDEFGLYVFGFTVLMAIEALQNNLISVPLNIIGAGKNRSEWEQIVFNSIFMSMILALCISLILFSIFYAFIDTSYRENAIVLRSLIAASITFQISEIIRKAYLSSLNVFCALYMDIFSYLVRIVSIIAILHFNLFKATYVFYFISAGCIISSFFGIFKLRLKSKNVGIKISIIKEILILGKWTFLDWVPFILSSQLYIYMTTFTHGNKETGALGATRNLIAPLSIVLIGIMNYALPYFSSVLNEFGRSKLKALLREYFTFLFFGFLIYIIFINAFSRTILSFFYHKYSEYTLIVLIQSTGILLNLLFKPIDIYMKVLRRPKYIFCSRLISSFITALLCYPLISTFGITGSALTYLLAQSLMLISLLFYLNKIDPIPCINVFKIKL